LLLALFVAAVVRCEGLKLNALVEPVLHKLRR